MNKLHSGLLTAVLVTVPVFAAAAPHTIYFASGESRLDSTDQDTVAAASREFRETGSTSLTIDGHTDTVGSQTSNQALSERRAAAVREAMIANGIPASAISATGSGENRLALQTGDGVAEPENRRAVITVAAAAQPPAPAPAPVPQVSVEPVDRTDGRIGFEIGPYFGHSFDKDDESWQAGVNLTATYFGTSNLALSAEQAIFYNFGADDDGVGGRSAVGVDYYFGDYGEGDRLLPYVGANLGYKYIDGSGTGGWFVGPEVGINIFGFDTKIAYDVVEGRGGWDQGDLSATVGYTFRF